MPADAKVGVVTIQVTNTVGSVKAVTTNIGRARGPAPDSRAGTRAPVPRAFRASSGASSEAGDTGLRGGIDERPTRALRLEVDPLRAQLGKRRLALREMRG